jgi:hypothetical protein
MGRDKDVPEVISGLIRVYTCVFTKHLMTKNKILFCLYAYILLNANMSKVHVRMKVLSHLCIFGFDHFNIYD